MARKYIPMSWDVQEDIVERVLLLSSNVFYACFQHLAYVWVVLVMSIFSRKGKLNNVEDRISLFHIEAGISVSQGATRPKHLF